MLRPDWYRLAKGPTTKRYFSVAHVTLKPHPAASSRMAASVPTSRTDGYYKTNARVRGYKNRQSKGSNKDDSIDNVKFISKKYINQAEVYEQASPSRQKSLRHSEQVKRDYDASFPPLYARRVDVETSRLQEQLYREDLNLRQKLAKLPQQRAVVGGIIMKIEASVKTRGKGWMNHGQVIEELIIRGDVFEAILVFKWYRKEESVKTNLGEILKVLLASEYPGLAADVVQLAHQWQIPLTSYHIVAGIKGLKETVNSGNAVEKLKAAYQMCDWALAPSPENGNEPQFKDAEFVLPHVLFFAWRVPHNARNEVLHLVNKVCPAFKVDISRAAFLTQYFAGVAYHVTPNDEEATIQTVEDAVKLLQNVSLVDGGLMSSIILGLREQFKNPVDDSLDWEHEIGGLKWKNVLEIAFRAVRPDRKRSGPLAHIDVKRELATCSQLLGICNVLNDNQLARNWFHNYVLPVVLEAPNKELSQLDKNGNVQVLNIFNVFAALDKNNIATEDSRDLFLSVMSRIPNLDSRPALSRFIAETSRLERIILSKCHDEATAKKVRQTVDSTHKRILGGLPHTCVISRSLIKSWRYAIGDAARDYHRVPYLRSVAIDQLFMWDPKISQNRSFLKSPENLWAVAEIYELLQAEYVIMQRSSPKKTQSIQQLLHVMMHRLSAFVPGGMTPEIIDHHRANQVLMNIISKKAIPMPYDSDGKEPQWLMGPESKPVTADEIAKARVTKKFGARPKTERAEKTEKRRGTKRLRHKPTKDKSPSGNEILNSMLSMPDQFKR
ncbi:hypothetical protein B0I73DRAFT_134958 [Yarrowia lipolytica]|uniref:YALI0D25124p n=2 Tax=Yarrowia lipolytica TaxID=4952 RepID=Q6C7V1_YARLI|nr:YALI0D25124p [Yarrowia lipolytica CLIB122]RDW25204.1 hypothetical protein B0I71DRAFT_133045 [Yarrowia lipolytica]RDW37773.1 hypothetical protein B0I73DRAFT_134958 [Yarrowia lipolytica]CAG81465.1 YALI0D25124p [Yarrowia lipolytica CLIB122]|eukprot:XP_503261.1 YALI0D25124p [Yarrowia lipolytica CLIB122]